MSFRPMAGVSHNCLIESSVSIARDTGEMNTAASGRFGQSSADLMSSSNPSPDAFACSRPRSVSRLVSEEP
jgi:hypothetical protein